MKEVDNSITYLFVNSFKKDQKQIKAFIFSPFSLYYINCIDLFRCVRIEHRLTKVVIVRVTDIGEWSNTGNCW